MSRNYEQPQKPPSDKPEFSDQDTSWTTATKDEPRPFSQLLAELRTAMEAQSQPEKKKPSEENQNTSQEKQRLEFFLSLKKTLATGNLSTFPQQIQEIRQEIAEIQTKAREEQTPIDALFIVALQEIKGDFAKKQLQALIEAMPSSPETQLDEQKLSQDVEELRNNISAGIEADKQLQHACFAVLEEALGINLRNQTSSPESNELTHEIFKGIEDWLKKHPEWINEKEMIQANYFRIQLEKAAQTLQNYPVVQAETKDLYNESKRKNLLQRLPLQFNNELLQIILFSERDSHQVIWEFLTRPDVALLLAEAHTQSLEAHWGQIKRMNQGDVKQGDEEKNDFFAKQRELLQKKLREQSDTSMAAILLGQLGIDTQFLHQALEARAKNNNIPFQELPQAAVALWGEGGEQWWKELQEQESNQKFLEPLILAQPLLNDQERIIDLPMVSYRTASEKQIFAMAMSLKHGLDTANKFLKPIPPVPSGDEEGYT